MGNNSSQSERRRRSSTRSSSQMAELSKKIDEKEYIFIALQAEVDRAIMEINEPTMKLLGAELAAHIMDLNQLKQFPLPYIEKARSQKVIHNFEILLAKLKSVLNSDTIKMKTTSENSTFYTNEPDIVTDLIRFDANDNHRQAASGSKLPSTPSVEDVIDSIEDEFEVLRDQLNRPIDDINQLYQMDKGAFYLQAQLENLEMSACNERKMQLFKSIVEFRELLAQKTGELEEQRGIAQEVYTLEMLVDSATEKDLEGLKARGLMLQETIEKSSWEQYFVTKKIDLLRRLARVLESIAYTVSPANSLRKSIENLYGNLTSMQEELDKLKAQEELDSIQSIDKVLEELSEDEDQEALYGNVEVIRENANPRIVPRLNRTSSNVSQRGTVYVNAEIVKENGDNDGQLGIKSKLVKKPPLPLPRNYEEKCINDLPKYWQRLNEILDSNVLSDANILEVADIQKHAEMARALFERKIRKIYEKSEESVEL